MLENFRKVTEDIENKLKNDKLDSYDKIYQAYQDSFKAELPAWNSSKEGINGIMIGILSQMQCRILGIAH